MLGESTRAELGFDLLNLSGESAAWAYPGWHIPIKLFPPKELKNKENKRQMQIEAKICQNRTVREDRFF